MSNYQTTTTTTTTSTTTGGEKQHIETGHGFRNGDSSSGHGSNEMVEDVSEKIGYGEERPGKVGQHVHGEEEAPGVFPHVRITALSLMRTQY